MMNVIELQAMSLTTYIICDQQLCSVFTSPTFFLLGGLNPKDRGRCFQW